MQKTPKHTLTVKIKRTVQQLAKSQLAGTVGGGGGNRSGRGGGGGRR